MNKYFWCNKCNSQMGEFEVATFLEPYGRGFSVCPKCRGDLEEMQKCDLCGEYEIQENLERDLGYDGNVTVCTECISQYTNNFALLEKIKGTEEIRIPSIYAYILTPDEVNKALQEYAEKIGRERDCYEFARDNLEEFVKLIKEREV